MAWKTVPGEAPIQQWTEAQDKRDLAVGMSRQKRTMEVVRSIADLIVPGISFTVDTPERVFRKEKRTPD